MFTGQQSELSNSSVSGSRVYKINDNEERQKRWNSSRDHDGHVGLKENKN